MSMYGKKHTLKTKKRMSRAWTKRRKNNFRIFLRNARAVNPTRFSKKKGVANGRSTINIHGVFLDLTL